MDFKVMLNNLVEAEQILANKNRLLILSSLYEKELSVSQLNQAVPLAQSALSQHLATLRKGNVVVTRRENQLIYYRLTDNKAVQLLNNLSSG